jgi:hypothetical protein
MRHTTASRREITASERQSKGAFSRRTRLAGRAQRFRAATIRTVFRC